MTAQTRAVILQQEKNWALLAHKGMLLGIIDLVHFTQYRRSQFLLFLTQRCPLNFYVVSYFDPFTMQLIL